MTGFDWRESAACRGMGTALFFHEHGEEPVFRRLREARAKAVCASCPVEIRCLTFALSFECQDDDGIFAGKTGDERKALRHAWLKRQQRAEGQAA